MSEGTDTSDHHATGGADEAFDLRGYLTGGLIWSGVGLVLAVLLALAVNALAARLLSVADLAAFLLLLSVGQSLGATAELGLPPLVVRALAEDRTGHGAAFLGRAWALVVTASVAIMLLGVAAARPVAAFITEQPAVVELAPWVGVLIALRGLERLAGDSFRGLHDVPRAVGYGSVGTQAGAALLLAVLALTDLRNPHLAIGAYAAGGAATVLLAAWLLRRHAASPPWRGVRRHARPMLRESWPLVGHRSMFLVLQQGPLWVVGALLAAGPTADYGLAQRVVTLIGFPLLMVNQVVPPLITTGARQDPARLERTLRGTAALAALPAVVVLAVLVLAGEPLMSLLFGAEYASAARPLALLSLGQLANVLAGSAGVVLTQTGNQRTLMVITVAATVVTLAGAALVARPWGVDGVAMVAAVGIAAQNVAMVMAVRRRVGVRTWVGRAALREVADEARRATTRRR